MNLQKRIAAIFLFLAFGTLHAQNVIPTKGKEFWFGYMQNYTEFADPSEATNVFIASDQDTQGILEIPGQGYSQPFVVQANVITTITIPQAMSEHISNETVDYKGIHILSEDTIAVFAINFASYTADGSKILPVQSIGTEYRIISYQGLDSYGSEFLIVATEDGTEIEITPSAPTPNGNPANVPFTIQLDQGESYQVKSPIGTSDYTGTVIKGTEASGDCRPFAVFSGTGCVNIPVGCFACDHIFDQSFPVNTWGTDFFVVPFELTTSYTYRVLADEDDTEVTINGGTTVNLDAGEFVEYNDVSTAQCVSGDKPICVTQYMEGVDCAGNGDPAMCILNDETQKIDYITFSTVESDVITDHALNIIMNTAEVGTAMLNGVTLDPGDFTPFPDCPSHSFAQIPLTEGAHTLEAPNGFTAYVYGVGSAESYAYSVGSFSSDPIIIENVTCTSDTVTITTENLGLNNIYWYAQTDPDVILGNGPQLTLYPPIISDIYVAVGSSNQSGCIVEELFSVEVPDPPTLTMSQDMEICQYQSVQLGVEPAPFSSNYTYSWTPTTGLDNPTSQYPIATPLENTTYSVYVSTISGCGSNTGTVDITIIDGNITSFETTATPSVICEGDDSQLFADIQQNIFEDNFDPGIVNSNWADISNGTVNAGCGSETGNALWFNGAGDRYVTTIPLDLQLGGTVNFSLKIGNAAFPCDNADFGENVVLEYSTTGDGGPWILIQTFTESLYPNFVGLSVPVPPGAETANTTFRWRQLTNSGNDQDNWSLDNIYIGSSDISGLNFSWSPNYNISSTTITNPTISPTVDTTYYVTMTDNMTGCDYIDSVFVNVDPNFNISMPDDIAICSTGDQQLFATPDTPGNYQWLWTGDGLSNPFIENPSANPTQTTTYTVVVESEGSCTEQGEVTITVNQLLDLNITASDDLVCADEAIYLTGNVSGSLDDVEFLWTPATGLNDATIQNPIANISGEVTYSLTITDTQSGCTLEDDIDLEAMEAFTIDAGEDQVLCVVEGFVFETTFDSPDNLTWQWTNASLLNSANISNPTLVVNQGGVFEVTATNAAGCSQTDEITIELLYESVDLGDQIEICEGESVTLSSNLDDSMEHTWSTGETTVSIDVDQAGVYTLTINSGDGCELTDEVEVIVHSIPIVDFGVIPVLCDGEPFSLNAGNPGSTYLWNTNQQTQSISISQSGTYSVEVESAEGCIGENEVTVNFNPPPAINLVETDTICSDEFNSYDAGNPGSLYQWSNGETTQVITTNEPGVYTVVVTTAAGCSNQDETNLVVHQNPVVDLGPDIGLCRGEKATLNAGAGDFEYTWNTGGHSNSIEVWSSGIYNVSVVNGVCTYVDEIIVHFDQPAKNIIPEEIDFCFDECPDGFNINAGNSGYSYVWNDMSTLGILTATKPGPYSVSITSPHGCERDFSTVVVNKCANGVFVPNAFTPNGDGINDLFRVVGDERIEEFEMLVFNRFGDIIWKAYDINEFWNGDGGSENYYSQSSIYPYSLKFKHYTGCRLDEPTWEEYKGQITLIR